VYPLRAVQVHSVALQTLISSNVAELLAVVVPFASRRGTALPSSIFDDLASISIHLLVDDYNTAHLDRGIHNPATFSAELVHDLAGQCGCF
jgi:hypothetical protein